MSAQFFGRSGKVLYGAFSIVGMASQPHDVNKGIPDDRVARSRMILDYEFEYETQRVFKYTFILNQYKWQLATDLICLLISDSISYSTWPRLMIPW